MVITVENLTARLKELDLAEDARVYIAMDAEGDETREVFRISVSDDDGCSDPHIVIWPA